MRWGLLVITGLFACGGGQGADVQVHADGVTFDSVQLFITYDTCKDSDGNDCPSVGWPQLPQTAMPVEGKVWVLKGDELLVRTATLEGGDGVLHLEAAPGYQDTRAIAIVAFSRDLPVAAKVLHDVHIPAHDEQHWYVELEPTDAASTDLAPPASGALPARAVAWAREPSPDVLDTTGYAGCFAYQQWDGTKWETEYFVPATDPDCDGNAPDCNPTWNHAPTAAARCLTRLELQPTVCSAGLQMCVDEGQGTCKAGPIICTPSLLCDCWNPADPPVATELQTCVREHLLDDSGAIPGQLCSFIPDPDMPTQGCSLNGNGEHMTFLVPGMCGVAANVTTPIATLRSPLAPFVGNSSTMQIENATFNVHATFNGSACLVDLGWVQNTPTPSSGHTVIVAIKYGLREILVPVYIDFSMGLVCPTGDGACTPFGAWPTSGGSTGDSMFLCTNPA